MYKSCCFALLILLYLLSACAPAAQKVVIMPTLAVLPSVTPLPTHTPIPTNTPSPTKIPSPTATLTPNLLETQVAGLQATNDAAQTTLAALLTKDAPTEMPAVTLTPSQTITATLTPSLTPPPVVALQPQLVYAQSAANLRTCASRSCAQIVQLQSGEGVMATGMIQGEAITSGKPIWYRVDYLGNELYVYSELVSIAPPTTVPISVAPPTNPPIFASPPVSVPQSSGGSGSCPDIHASCSALTCDQAYACLAAGHRGLDNDHDGVPCESICSGG